MRCEKVGGAELAQILPVYQAFKASHQEITVVQDLEWILHTRKDELDQAGAYVLRNGSGTISGYAPFLIQNRPLRCFVGELKLGEVPLRCLMLLGAPHFPDNEEAYAALIEETDKLGSEIDGLFVFGLPLNSFLWNYLEKSPAISQRFIRYLPEKPDRRIMIDLPKSHEEYMQKLTPKNRNTLKRRVARLEKESDGQLQLVCATSSDQVDGFLEEAVRVSQKSYQWHLLGLGLRDLERWRKNLKFLAGKNWLRSYLLRCRGVPVAFTICYQDDRCCYYVNTGYDQDWGEYNVGTVLQFMMLKDIFAHNRPVVVDLGRRSGGHKKVFGNTSFLDCDVYLLRRNLRSSIAYNTHRASQFVSEGISDVLDRLKLKRLAKQTLRKSSV
jgi:hypothetical protein